MTEAEWLTSHDLPRMLAHLADRALWAEMFWNNRSRPWRNRKLRLFLAACCRRNWSRLSDSRSREAVEVGERFADGLADAAQLKTVHEAAGAVAEAVRELPDVSVYRAAFLATAVAEAEEELEFTAYDQESPLVMSPPFDWDNVDGLQLLQHLKVINFERTAHAALLREIFGNPFRPVRLDPSWRTSAVLSLARDIYESQTFDRFPVLADALEDAGCENADVLNHCRQEGSHLRGCWVIDLLMGQRG